MGARAIIEEALEATIWMVEIIRSRLASDSDVELLVDGSAGDGDEDSVDFSEVWTIAGVQSRPKDGSDSAGFAKGLRFQLGDEVFLVATHDPREVEACAVGEVVVHALGKDGTARALIRLKPDGTVEIEGDKVKLAAPGASDVDPIASGDGLFAFADGFLNATPTPQDGGLALQIATAAAMAALGFAVGVPPAAVTVQNVRSTKHDVEI